MRRTLGPRRMNMPMRSVSEGVKRAMFDECFSQDNPAKASPIEPEVVAFIESDAVAMGPEGTG